MYVPRCTLYQYHCTEIVIPDLGCETYVCFTLYLVSVSLQQDPPSGFGT